MSEEKNVMHMANLNLLKYQDVPGQPAEPCE